MKLSLFNFHGNPQTALGANSQQKSVTEKNVRCKNDVKNQTPLGINEVTASTWLHADLVIWMHLNASESESDSVRRF